MAEKQKPQEDLVKLAGRAMSNPDQLTGSDIKRMAARILDDQRNAPAPNKSKPSLASQVIAKVGDLLPDAVTGKDTAKSKGSSAAKAKAAPNSATKPEAAKAPSKPGPGVEAAAPAKAAGAKPAAKGSAAKSASATVVAAAGKVADVAKSTASKVAAPVAKATSATKSKSPKK